jgi:hypothetical protein
MPPTSVYKIRKLRKKEGGNERGFEACSLAVPIDVAERLSDDLKFTVELTEDGILYRGCLSSRSLDPASLPSPSNPT